MDTNENEPHLDLSVDLKSFFQDALGAALSERGVEATEPTSHYLVGLLADYAHPGDLVQETLERPLPFLLQEALATTGSERFDRLRALGDAVLYTSGFFLDHLEVRGVELDYASRLGARAYGGAASMLRRGAGSTQGEHQRAPELFQELSDGFHRFARVLATVADGLFASSSQVNDTGMLRLYERWLRTGSSQLAQALAAQGVVPTRGRGGLN
ncbi:MAG TPA: hypothetical protein VIM73_10135 [Polyangiaceae bacterium]